jgi:malate synthase
VLTPDALRFVGTLCAKFEPRRQALLSSRKSRALALDGGELPAFSKDPAVQDPGWQCAPIPTDVQDRRVEITGPVDRKMVINGLNSGACVYMADFEDSTSPTFTNVVEGQLNLRDAVNKTIRFEGVGGKLYQLHEKTATLFVRPRGWHLDEGHVLVNGRPASGGIFDFALFLYHNHRALLGQGTQPYYYLPKLENRYEARLWNDVIESAQSYLGIPSGTVRATVLLETITAAFEMEEILYELKDHMLGLNCGRWDYLFSYIKKFKLHPDKITPDRSHLTMTAPLMDAYVKRLVYLCHKRGTFAMGGMSAAIPVKDDPARNEAAMHAVQLDKIREVTLGHDGTWVAHPALVQVAKKVFDDRMKAPNQIRSHTGMTAGVKVTEADLLTLPDVPSDQAVTSAHLAKGVGIVLAYTEAWLRGVGCIPLHGAMEDAATAEISRAQIWSWRTHHIRTADDGLEITADRIADLVREIMLDQSSATTASGKGKWLLAGKLVENMLNKYELDDFLTTVCYPHILSTYEVTSESGGGSSKL